MVPVFRRVSHPFIKKPGVGTSRSVVDFSRFPFSPFDAFSCKIAAMFLKGFQCDFFRDMAHDTGLDDNTLGRFGRISCEKMFAGMTA
jgi:hypothetical protein